MLTDNSASQILINFNISIFRNKKEQQLTLLPCNFRMRYILKYKDKHFKEIASKYFHTGF